MSTHYGMPRNENDVLAALNYEEENEELLETGSITFPDGYCIELVKDHLGSLALCGSRNKKFLQRIKRAGHAFVPPNLAPSVLEALTFPQKRTDCGSTVEMFGGICNFFLGYGVSEDAARACTYFAFASWFPEFLPVAPCLVFNGAEAEASVLLQLLTCVVRQALPVAEINAAIFRCLPMRIQPTMLIGYVHPSMWRLFSASNHPHTYLPNKNGLTNLYCAKAAYAGPTSCGVRGDGILSINCSLYGGKLPLINGGTLKQIAAQFQPKLLDYRLKHVVQVRDANFDAKTLPIALRMAARALGSCIVDAPDLQADIVRLLESQAGELRANRLLDPNCVAIEALLACCHGDNGDTRVGVSEIADRVTTIMADRGEATIFESKAMGGHLRRLGFRPKRDSRGFAIHLTPDVRRFIHRLARDHEIGDSEQPVPGCLYCTELTSAQMEGSNP